MNKKELDINEMYEKFCCYVDVQKHFIDSKIVDLKKISNYYGFESNNCKSTYNLENLLSDELEKTITSEKDFRRNDLRKLEKHIILEYYIANKDLFPYLQIIRILNDHLQNGIMIVDISNEKAWSKIIRICIDIFNLSSNKEELDIENILNYDQEMRNLIDSSKSLKKRGYDITVSNGRLFIDEKTNKKISTKIENMILDLGGLNVCKIVFNLIKPTYNKIQKRYIITRNLSTISSKTKNTVPINYLIQLSLKHLTNFSKYKIGSRGFETEWKELIDLVSSYVGIMGFEKFSIYSDMFIQAEDLPFYFKENILYDKLFTFRQWNPDYIMKLSIDLYKNIFEKYIQNDELGYSIDEFISIEKEILGCGENFQKFDVNNLHKKLKEISKERIELLLNKLSHENSQINNEFTTIDTQINFNEKPLVKIGKESYLLTSPSLCSFSFINVLENDLRSIIGKEFDNLLGRHLEKFLKGLLAEKGFKYKDGFYDEQSECDLILETDKQIIFIEIKKKALTQKAYNGDDIQFLNDIGKSLINSQIQLGNHEIYIRKNKKIILRKCQSKKKSNKYEKHELLLNNRIIERISLTYRDYGFINSKMVVSQIVQLLIGLDIHTRDPLLDNELEDLRKKLEILMVQSQELIDIDENKETREVFFDISFRSVQQFLLALERSKNIDEFVDILLIDKYISTGSYDFYSDVEALNYTVNHK